MKRLFTLAFAAAAFAAAACAPATPDAETDHSAIEALLTDTLTGADTLRAGPVTIIDDTAITGWTQGRTGGRALLHREAGEWRILLLGSDQISTRHGLEHHGVAPELAARLAVRLSEAERNEAPERLALMSSFFGVMRMDNSANHPAPHHGDNTHGAQDHHDHMMHDHTHHDHADHGAQDQHQDHDAHEGHALHAHH